MGFTHTGCIDDMLAVDWVVVKSWLKVVGLRDSLGVVGDEIEAVIKGERPNTRLG